MASPQKRLCRQLGKDCTRPTQLWTPRAVLLTGPVRHGQRYNGSRSVIRVTTPWLDLRPSPQYRTHVWFSKPGQKRVAGGSICPGGKLRLVLYGSTKGLSRGLLNGCVCACVLVLLLEAPFHSGQKLGRLLTDQTESASQQDISVTSPRLT